MTAKKRSMTATWSDTDDSLELTEEFFQQADQYEGSKLKPRGRPKPPSHWLTRLAPQKHVSAVMRRMDVHATAVGATCPRQISIDSLKVAPAD